MKDLKKRKSKGSLVGWGELWLEYKSNKALANPSWAPEQRLPGRGTAHWAEIARLRTLLCSVIDWGLPETSVAFSQKLRRTLTAWIARGCQLRLGSVQLNAKLFLEGQHRQCLPTVVREQSPYCWTTISDGFAVLVLWFSGFHPHLKIPPPLCQSAIVTGDTRLPIPEVAGWRSKDQNVQDWDGQGTAQGWVGQRLTDHWPYP